MPVDFYFFAASPPCRGVLVAANLIGVKLNLKYVNLMKGEHMTPEFLKMNPQHQVPTIDDNGFYLHESRAIITYLFNKYGKEDSLYPKDPQKRALVDKALYFDMGTLFQRFGEYIRPPMFEGAPFDPEKLKKIGEAFEFLDKTLGESEFAAGDSITLADAALVATVSTVDAIHILDLSKYQNVTAWLEKCKKAIPDYEEANGNGAAAFAEFFAMKTKK